MKVETKVLEQVINNGNYEYLGFMVIKKGESKKHVVKGAVKNTKGEIVEEEVVEIENINGSALVLFKKDNTLYFVDSDSIKKDDESKGWAYGKFQPYLNPANILCTFHISVEDKVLDIVPLQPTNPIEA
jgi:hypothetical protein